MFILQGVEDYGMLRNGDRVLVCLSGGKDSLSLLHTIRQYQFYSRAKVCTVNNYYLTGNFTGKKMSNDIQCTNTPQN